MGSNLEKANILLPKPIKELGEHKVKIKLDQRPPATIKIHIEPA